MNRYIVNKNDTYNPGRHHEVHAAEHANTLDVRNFIDLGVCSSGVEAKRKAKAYYNDADGCAICCPEAHEG
jgi:hypothetical protein